MYSPDVHIVHYCLSNYRQTITHNDNIRTPVSKIHGANMVPIWGQQDPCGPHAGPMNVAILDNLQIKW